MAFRLKKLWTRAFWRQRVTTQRGFIMIVASMLLSGLLAVAMVGVQRTRHHTSQATRNYQETRVFYAAEGAAAVAQSWLVDLLATNSNPTQEVLNGLLQPDLPGFNLVTYGITKAPQITGREITSGPFAGMTANIQPYRVVAHAENPRGTVDAAVNVTIDQQLVGMYQFGIYYEEDLEIFPNFPLDYNGRIHTNSDLYLGSHNTLDITGHVTSAGHIYSTPKDETRHYNGKARMRDLSGHWHDLRYDSGDPDWVARSLEDWDGLVMDSAHGVPPLPFPIPAPAGTIEIIRRGLPADDEAMRAKRFWYKAGLRIVDGVARDSAGNVLTIPANLITTSTVYDYRERRNMTMVNININTLRTAAILPANRIVYISYAGTGAAVRLINGSTLPTGGLTIATDNPLYIQGNYNTVSKKPSSILCDAFNVYSVNWSDGNATKALNKRLARATTINTCVVAGNTNTTNGHYNGGAENLIRLHEKWVGHELTFRGSLVCIYRSEQAVGDFNNASYEEAHRDWAFDPDLLNNALWPKGELAVSTVSRSRWSAN